MDNNELASDLVRGANFKESFNHMGYTIRDLSDGVFLENGLNIVHPYWNDYADPRKAEETKHLVSEEWLGEDVLDFLLQIQAKREEAGLSDPLDYLSSLLLILKNNKMTETGLLMSDYARGLLAELNEVDIEEIPNFTEVDGYNGFFAFPQYVEQLARLCFTDDVMKSALVDHLTFQCGDLSAGWLDREEVFNLFKHLGLDTGVLLDVGCGVGLTSQILRERTNFQVLSFDRQYNGAYYLWNNADQRGLFAKAEMRQIPLKNNSVDVAYLEFITTHTTPEVLASSLDELLRVVKENGFVIIGPYRKAWIVLQKEEVPEGLMEESVEILEKGTQYTFQRKHGYKFVKKEVNQLREQFPFFSNGFRVRDNGYEEFYIELGYKGTNEDLADPKLQRMYLIPRTDEAHAMLKLAATMHNANLEVRKVVDDDDFDDEKPEVERACIRMDFSDENWRDIVIGDNLIVPNAEEPDTIPTIKRLEGAIMVWERTNRKNTKEGLPRIEMKYSFEEDPED